MTPGGPAIRARILENRELPDPDFREMTLDAGEVAARALPGQFVHVRLPDVLDPLLRRPFSVAGTEGGRLTIVYKKVGKLTSKMTRLPAGTEVDVFGPRGRGYRLDGPKARRAFLVGGGYGAAPLLFLARTLRARALADGITLLVGARKAEQLLWRDRIEAEKPWLTAAFATEDGSAGEKGTVLDLLEKLLPASREGIRLCACGPSPMLAAIPGRFPGVPAEVAAEGHMGCGMGVCQGCVLPMKGASGVARYARVCLEGPVFDADAVDWPAVLEAKL